jgi:hypothetical protein
VRPDFVPEARLLHTEQTREAIDTVVDFNHPLGWVCRWYQCDRDGLD